MPSFLTNRGTGHAFPLNPHDHVSLDSFFAAAADDAKRLRAAVGPIGGNAPETLKGQDAKLRDFMATVAAEISAKKPARRGGKVKLIDDQKPADAIIDEDYQDEGFRVSLLNDGRMIAKSFGRPVSDAFLADIMVERSKGRFVGHLRKIGKAPPAAKKVQVYDQAAIERAERRKAARLLKGYRPKNYDSLDFDAKRLVDDGITLSQQKRLERRQYAVDNWQFHLNPGEAEALRNGTLQNVPEVYARVYRHLTGENPPTLPEGTAKTTIYEPERKYKSISVFG